MRMGSMLCLGGGGGVFRDKHEHLDEPLKTIHLWKKIHKMSSYLESEEVVVVERANGEWDF